MTGYIYLITNTQNQKSYVGQTRRNPPSIRIEQHFHQPRRLTTSKRSYIDSAIQSHGRESFDVRIIEEIDSNNVETLVKKLDVAERKWIKELQTFKHESG